jgi:hypothetical protein
MSNLVRIVFFSRLQYTIIIASISTTLSRTMADAATTFLPSLRVNYQPEGSANQSCEPPHTPTWPAYLESPYVTGGQPQPNLCLQVTQVLEWEMWTHDQTRGRLRTEQARCEQLYKRNQRLEQDVGQWRQSCDTVYAALSDHRIAHASLQRDMDGVVAEISELRQQQCEAKVSSFAHRPSNRS